MHLRLLAVGDRQPAWVEDAFTNYAQRLPRDWRFQLSTIPTVRRGKNDRSTNARDTEGKTLLAKLSAQERVIVLDERGRQRSSKELADAVQQWQSDGRDVCFIIGGPDGVSDAVRQRADTVWSLGELTLPHGLARVLLVEQLYRAWSLLTGHPYHRE